MHRLSRLKVDCHHVASKALDCSGAQATVRTAATRHLFRNSGPELEFQSDWTCAGVSGVFMCMKTEHRF